MSPARDCLTCKGKGTLIERYKDRRGRWQKREVSCSACDGTGELAPYHTKRGSRPTPKRRPNPNDHR